MAGLTAAILSLFCTAAAFSQGASASLDVKRIDDYLAEVNKAYHIPGMAFFITDADKTIFANSYGQCRDMNCQFFIGSESKSFTALCIMQLVEKGAVRLDDDITRYLDGYRFSKQVTVRDLLNQTSGFDSHMKLTDVKLTESYGRYEYANINYDLLGKIVESVSGMAYAEYIRSNVFAPLGMGTSCASADSVRTAGTLLPGNRNLFGLFVKGDADYPTAKSWFHEPAGFIATTPADMQEYLRMYLNGGRAGDGKQIISGESIRSMWYDNVPIDRKETARYGMGWNRMLANGAELIFHGGQVENYISYMFILPQEGLAVSFMINGNDEFGMNVLMNNAFWDLLSIIYGRPTKNVSHAIYPLIHLALDAVYLLMLALSLLILLRPVKPVRPWRAKRLVLMFAAYIAWPLLLLTFTKLFFDTPLWVVKSYVPDLFWVIVASAVLSICGAVRSAVWRTQSPESAINI